MNHFTALDTYLSESTRTGAGSGSTTPAMSSAFRPLFSKDGEGLNHELLHGHSEPRAHAEPHVELIQAEGRIAKIIVTCGCGERIELSCAY